MVIEKITNSRFMSDKRLLIILAAIVGMLAGFGAHLLKTLIKWISMFVVQDMNFDKGNTILLITPVLGIVLVSLYQKYILHKNLEHGVERLNGMLDVGNYYMGKSSMYNSILTSSVTIGMGGSAGAEGPIAYTGAAIGSNFGRWFNLDNRMMMLLIGCGAGAGIAGIFKAPMGGVLFALEVLHVEFTTIGVTALVIASLMAWFIAYICTGCTPDITFVADGGFDAQIVPYVIILGIISGFYSIYYSSIMKKMNAFYTGINSTLKRALTGGVILSTLIFLFPYLFGEGYQILMKLINGNEAKLLDYSIFYPWHDNQYLVLLVLVGVLATKAFANATTNSSGGVGGNFAPTLFAGAVLGYVFASFINLQFGTSLPTGVFALIGTSGAMSGITKAPLMAVFLTVEMSFGYEFLLPLLMASAISYTIVKFIPELCKKR